MKLKNGRTEQVEICGKSLSIGDYVEIEYTTGELLKNKIFRGKITDLWGDIPRVRINYSWCFYEHDKILKHIPYGHNQTFKKRKSKS